MQQEGTFGLLQNTVAYKALFATTGGPSQPRRAVCVWQNMPQQGEEIDGQPALKTVMELQW